MTEMKAARTGSLLMRAYLVPRRSGKTKSGGRHCFSWRLKRYDWEAVSQCYERVGGTPQRMTSQPDICIGIKSRNVSVNLLRSIVVAILVLQSLHNTC